MDEIADPTQVATLIITSGRDHPLQTVAARHVQGRLYELIEQPFVHLVPGDVVAVDEFGVVSGVASYRPVYVAYLLYDIDEPDAEQRMLAESDHWRADLSVEVYVESAVGCRVTAPDLASLHAVEASSSGGLERIMRTPSGGPAIDIWDQGEAD